MNLTRRREDAKEIKVSDRFSDVARRVLRIVASVNFCPKNPVLRVLYAFA